MCPQPDIVLYGDPHSASLLLHDCDVRPVDAMTSSIEVRVGRNLDMLANLHDVGREDLTVEGYVRTSFHHDVPILAIQNGVSSNEHAIGDEDTLVLTAFGVKNAVVIDHNVVAQVDLVRVPEDNVRPENHPSTDLAKEKAIEVPSQHEPKHTRHPTRDQDDQLIPYE